MAPSQTQISQHFTPRSQRNGAAAPSSSRPSATRPPTSSRYARRRPSPSDSEGSEGMAAIKFTQPSSPSRPTLQGGSKTKGKILLDSDDEDDAHHAGSPRLKPAGTQEEPLLLLSDDERQPTGQEGGEEDEELESIAQVIAGLVPRAGDPKVAENSGGRREEIVSSTDPVQTDTVIRAPPKVKATAQTTEGTKGKGIERATENEEHAGEEVIDHTSTPPKRTARRLAATTSVLKEVSPRRPQAGRPRRTAIEMRDQTPPVEPGLEPPILRGARNRQPEKTATNAQAVPPPRATRYRGKASFLELPVPKPLSRSGSTPFVELNSLSAVKRARYLSYTPSPRASQLPDQGQSHRDTAGGSKASAARPKQKNDTASSVPKESPAGRPITGTEPKAHQQTELSVSIDAAKDTAVPPTPPTLEPIAGPSKYTPPARTSPSPFAVLDIALNDSDLQILTDDDDVPLTLPPSVKQKRAGKTAVIDSTFREKASKSAIPKSSRSHGGKSKKRAVGNDSDESEAALRKAKPAERPAKSVPRHVAKAQVSSRGATGSKSSRNKRNNSSEGSVRLPKKHKTGNLKKKARDPDDDEAITEDEEDMVDGLQMDEPERFKSKTRLRQKKETPLQRNLRKIRNKRLGIEESSSEDDLESGNRSSPGTYTSDSAPDSNGKGADSDDFIEEDDGAVPLDMPAQFSNNAAQTPEFKFKVVFHYFVMLVVKGPNVLPLRGENYSYFIPPLQDLRRRVAGYRDSRVKGLWSFELVQALQTFPTFDEVYLDFPANHCDVCNRNNKASVYKVFLRGDPYDRETHIALDSSEESGSDEPQRKTTKEKTAQKHVNLAKAKAKVKERRRRSPSSVFSANESEADNLPEEFQTGRFCKQRIKVFHQMSHWEDELFRRIRNNYHDLLRAKHKDILPVDDTDASSSAFSDDSEGSEEKGDRKAALEKQRAATKMRVVKLKRQDHRAALPSDTNDVDQVTEWMDLLGYQTRYRWFEDLVLTSERLLHDKSTDG